MTDPTKMMVSFVSHVSVWSEVHNFYLYSGTGDHNGKNG